MTPSSKATAQKIAEKLQSENMFADFEFYGGQEYAVKAERQIDEATDIIASVLEAEKQEKKDFGSKTQPSQGKSKRGD